MGRNGELALNCVLMDPAKAMVYIGEFMHQLDARNRVTVPSSWRVAGDDGNFYFAWPHLDGCIAVFPPEMQEELLEKARSIRQSDQRGQKLLRQIFGKGFKFGCDKQGRILLPEALRVHAGIEKEVVLVGMGRNFQLWDSTKFNADDDMIDDRDAWEEFGL